MTLSASARTLAVAAGVSVAFHAALFVGDWPLVVNLEEEASPSYQATLVDAPAEPPPPAPAAAPRPRAVATLPAGAMAFLPSFPEAPTQPALEEAPDIVSAPSPAEASSAAADATASATALPPAAAEPPPVVAMAAPTAPPPIPDASPFRHDAIPGEVSIRYTLSSPFADGEADYTWRREGDRYEITGSARASGFFAMFLEGSIDQRTVGRVTPEGLRPERFLEWRPGAPPEGLAFDWDARTVTQSRGGRDQVAPLEGNTIDWLSLVFQLAHQPPREGATDLRVYTQRRLYTYRLEVVGVEEVNLPIGRVRALHVRHGTAGQPDAVDVWLGIDQHYLPVKLRYPVARNRLVIEQTARAISTR